MQWPEIVFLLAMLAAALSVLLTSGEPYRRQLLGLALVLGVAEGWYRVAPWQLLPAALGWVVLVLAFGRRKAANPVLAGVALALISTSVGLLIVLPFFVLPRPTGQYGVGTRIVFLDDLDRTIDGTPRADVNLKQAYRTLVAQVWYPAQAGSRGLPQRYVRVGEMKPLSSYQAGIRTNAIAVAPVAGGALPVLIYGHSWGGRRTVDTFLCEELASHGYVVVALDHPLNTAREELADGRVIRSTQAAALNDPEHTGTQGTLKIWADEMAVWVADDRFVLRQLAAGEGSLGWLKGHVDLGRVGAFGHSFGGAAAFSLLGQPAEAGVPAVRAGVNLDGWTFAGLDRRTTEPAMMIYAGEPFSPAAPPESGVNGELDRMDRTAVEGSFGRYGGTLLYIPRTQHLDFTDQTLVSPFHRLTYTGPVDGERVRTITRGLLVAFFDRALKGSAQALPSYAEVKVAR